MKILLPVDGSELALDAVHHVLKLVAEGLRAEVVLTNVQTPATLYEIVVAPDAEAIGEVSSAAGEHALAPAAALLAAAGVPCESEVVSGDPAHLLLEVAERHGVDAIVMGARGVGGLRHALLGSVSNTVLHDAGVPVTIVGHAAVELADDAGVDA